MIQRNGTKTEQSIEKIIREHATINGTELELVSKHWPAGWVQLFKFKCNVTHNDFKVLLSWKLVTPMSKSYVESCWKKKTRVNVVGRCRRLSSFWRVERFSSVSLNLSVKIKFKLIFQTYFSLHSWQSNRPTTVLLLPRSGWTESNAADRAFWLGRAFSISLVFDLAATNDVCNFIVWLWTE